MNERINELAIQAGGIWRGGFVEHPNGDSVYTDRKYVDGADMDVEQFAKLIVGECVEQCIKVEEHGNEYIGGGTFADATKLCRDAIEQHFGVEE